MINSSPFILDLTLILFVAAVVMLLCKYFHQPLLLGLLIAGLIVGPNVPFLPSVSEMSSVEIWAEFGVIFLLFTLGLSFTLKKLWKVGKISILIALIKNSVLIFSGYLIAYLFSLPPLTGLFVGALTSITSTILVGQCLEETDKSQEPFASVIMGVSIIEDVLVLFFLLFMGPIAQTQLIGPNELMISLIKKIGFVLLIIAGTYFIPRSISRMQRLLTPETTLILALAFCLIVAMISGHVGLSPGLGAFLAGMLISEAAHSRAIRVLLLPIRDLFAAIFFISIGMMIKPSVLLAKWDIIILLSILICLVKIVTTYWTVRFSKIKSLDPIALGITTLPIGEFSFIMASLGVSLKMITDDFYSVVVALSAISILITTYLMKHLDFIHRLSASLKIKTQFNIDS